MASTVTHDVVDLLMWVECQFNNEELFPTSAEQASVCANPAHNCVRFVWHATQMQLLPQHAEFSLLSCDMSGHRCSIPEDVHEHCEGHFQALVPCGRTHLLYYSHFDKIMSLSAEAHLNTCFKPFSVFTNIKEFDLVDSAELRPLAHLIDNLTNPAAAAGAPPVA
jgi:hypothetical protein